MTRPEVHLGRCEDIIPTLAEASVDMVLADLPYGTTRARWDTPIDLDWLWGELRRVAKPQAAMLFFAQTPFDKVLGASNLKELRYEWVWEKHQATGHLNARRAPMKAHENILVFYRSQPTYHPQKTQGHPRKVSTAEHKRGSKVTPLWGSHGATSYDSTERYPRSVLRYPTDKQKHPLHETQKPVALLEYLIRTYTNEGDRVLDPTAGALSTGVAAAACGRRSILVERELRFVEAGMGRFAA